MSEQDPAQPAEAEAQVDPAEATPPMPCPRCGAQLAPGQEWCLECGTAARTVIAPTPNWRAPIALVVVVVLLSGAAIAWALVALTDNDAEVRAATSAPTAAPATTTTAPPATPDPAAVTPTPDPAATTPDPTAITPDPSAATPDPAASPDAAEPGAAPALP